MLSPGYSVLLFSFPAVTRATNHVFITRPYIKLWVHSSIKRQPPEEGCSRHVLCQGNIFGEKHWKTLPCSSILLFDLSTGASPCRQMYICSVDRPQASSGWDPRGFMGLSSQPPPRSFHGHFWLVPSQCPVTLMSPKWSQGLWEPGGDVAVPKRSPLLN